MIDAEEIAPFVWGVLGMVLVTLQTIYDAVRLLAARFVAEIGR